MDNSGIEHYENLPLLQMKKEEAVNHLRRTLVAAAALPPAYQT